MLVHGTAPAGLLLSTCTLVPLTKNIRGNKCDSNNYRAIALSSELGKLFGIIILKEQSTSISILTCYSLDLNIIHPRLYVHLCFVIL